MKNVQSTPTKRRLRPGVCRFGFVQVPISEASNEGLPASGIAATVGVLSARAPSLAQDTLEPHYNSSVMAAGDTQRVWFPEMIERLRSQWRQGMSCDSLVGLRDDLDAMLQQIRSDRHIRPAVFRCPECGHIGEGVEPHVSVRAMILSLSRFGIAPAELTRPLEKEWAAYRKQKRVDLYGVASMPNDVAGCGHLVSGEVFRARQSFT